MRSFLSITCLAALGKSDETEAESESGESEATLDADLLEKVKQALGERVSEVRSSRRLTDSASCVVLGDQEMALHLQRLLEQAGQEVPDTRPVLELNPGHALVHRLRDENDESR